MADNKTTLTDDDLKLFKTRVARGALAVHIDELEALLARLEAAELYIETDRAYGDSQQLHNCYERWLASKGEK